MIPSTSRLSVAFWFGVTLLALAASNVSATTDDATASDNVLTLDLQAKDPVWRYQGQTQPVERTSSSDCSMLERSVSGGLVNITSLTGTPVPGYFSQKRLLGLQAGGANCGRMQADQGLRFALNRAAAFEGKVFSRVNLALNMKFNAVVEARVIANDALVATFTMYSGTSQVPPGAVNAQSCAPGADSGKDADATNCWFAFQAFGDALEIRVLGGSVGIGGTGSISTFEILSGVAGILPPTGLTEQVTFQGGDGGYVQCKRLSDPGEPVNYFLAANCTSTECRKDFLYDGPDSLRFVCEAWWPQETARFAAVSPAAGSFAPTRELIRTPTQQFWGAPPGVRGADLAFCGQSVTADITSSVRPIETVECAPEGEGGGNIAPVVGLGSCLLENISDVHVTNLIDQNDTKPGVQAGCLLDERVRLLSIPATSGATQLQQFQRWYLQGDYTALRTRPAP